MTVRDECPWYNTDIKLAKAKRRLFEDKWRENKLEVHREMYTSQRDITTALCDQAKIQYYLEKLAVRDQNQLYNVANNLLHRSAEELANKFSDFFQSKIQKLHSTI